MTEKEGNVNQARRWVLLAAVLAAGIGVLSSPGAAVAKFTCSNNDDCWETAQQCDPGGIPCNDGVCDPNSPNADAIGCVMIPNDGNCDDENFCNGLEFCDPHHGCQPGSPPSCNDQIPCTVDSCDVEEGRCKHDRKNSLCSNGLFCDGVERCDDEEGCVPGTPVDCDDDSSCTTDTCDENANECKHVEGPNSCNDGLFCNGVERCDPDGGCLPGNPPNCGDGIPCTVDACNEAQDRCTHTPNNSVCTDGDFCDGVEVCNPNSGCQAGPPPNCNDGVACTADLCNEATDSCTHQPNNSLCSDGQFCDGVEVCNPTKGCQAGPPPNCSDQLVCTVDHCVEATDTCVHLPNNNLCSNNLFCDGSEICSPSQGCIGGTPPDCSDDVPCTVDVCVESNNSCSHRENPSFCSDGLYCNGDERCDELLGCYFGIPPDCSDDTACTVDVCIEATDTCESTASNELCNNGLFCDGVEICSPLLGCTDGTPPDCSDDIECTDDICSNLTQSCLHPPDNTQCNNGLFCDGQEVCNPDMGCVDGDPISCNDQSVCTDDFCFEPEDECRNVPNGVLCGDGVFNPECGEECDEDNGEICNNDIDDDGDMLVDCADPDCNQFPIETCDDECRLVPPCVPLQRDPAVISFGVSAGALGDGTERAAPTGHGKYSFHARIEPTTPIDPISEGFLLTLSNANGEIYRAELDASDFTWTRSSYVYKAEDPEKVMAEGGIMRIGLRKRFYSGKPGFGIRFKAYGDFSRATLPHMTTQVYFGDDVGFVSATWSGEAGKWTLRPRDYDQSTGGVP
jgi:hypothetical protein